MIFKDLITLKEFRICDIGMLTKKYLNSTKKPNPNTNFGVLCKVKNGSHCLFTNFSVWDSTELQLRMNKEVIRDVNK